MALWASARPARERVRLVPIGPNVRRFLCATPRSAQGSSSYGDDDLAAGTALAEIPHGLVDLAQRERPVDDGHDLAGLEELAQRLQILLALGRDPGAQLLTHEQREHLRAELAIDASEPASAPFSSDDHERPLGGEGAPKV